MGITSNKLNFISKYGNPAVLSKDGYMVNLVICYQVNKWFEVDISPGMIQKNFTLRNTNNIHQNINNTYLHLPLSLKHDIYFLKNLNISGNLGLYYAYLIKSVISGFSPNVFEISSNLQGDELIKLENIKADYKITKQDNRSEFGWLGKVGLEYKIVNNVSCTIKGQYFRSITDQQKRINNAEPEKRNRTLVLSGGISYCFN